MGFLPVLTFLTFLFYLDSYKLVSPRAVVAVVISGAVAAVTSYLSNAAVLNAFHLDLPNFSLYVAPLIEEFWKGLIVLVLIRTHRIGFLVDAAIFGFAAGTGFALVENMHFFGTIANVGIGMWIVRGFGTAFMHGGSTALFAVIGLTLMERARRHGLLALLPGFGLAAILHSGFNHLADSPRLATL
ncbi:MAG: PrsW family glutamic-type intramembrane protease, partial [Betaproteobacteria bacterium]